MLTIALAILQWIRNVRSDLKGSIHPKMKMFLSSVSFFSEKKVVEKHLMFDKRMKVTHG